jgi:hypothetical protein
MPGRNGMKVVMQLCPVPPLRNEDARHVLRDGTVMPFCKLNRRQASGDGRQAMSGKVRDTGKNIVQQVESRRAGRTETKRSSAKLNHESTAIRDSVVLWRVKYLSSQVKYLLPIPFKQVAIIFSNLFHF